MHPLATRTPSSRRLAPNIAAPGRNLRLGVLLAGCLVMRGVAAMSLQIETTPAGDLFPALELSQSAADQGPSAAPAGNGLLRLIIRDPGRSLDLKLTLSTPGLSEPTVLQTRVSGDTVLRPRLRWDVAKLRERDGVMRQTLEVRASGPDMAPQVTRIDVRVHPLDEALYFVREGDSRIDLSWSFAAWVDPQHPVIDELLALAGVDDALPPAPLNRVERLRLARAIWAGLERRGLRYADESPGISQGPVIYSQRVRLLSDTWEDRVANCMDGSVLIASALERLGVGTFLVLIPGHAFVGFYTDDARHQAEFLETTLLGLSAPMKLDSAQAAGSAFDAARRAGRARYRQVMPRLDGRHRPDYALIDISTARAYGIMPLASGWGDARPRAPLAASTSSHPVRNARQRP
jgi:hypothetical protein